MSIIVAAFGIGFALGFLGLLILCLCVQCQRTDIELQTLRAELPSCSRRTTPTRRTRACG